MKETKHNASKIFKISLIISLAVLMIMSTATVAWATGQLNNVFLFDETEQETVTFDMTAGQGAISDMVIPTHAVGIVNVNVEEEGYYEMSASKNETTGGLIRFYALDENGEAANFADFCEDESVIIMFLDKGVHQFEIPNEYYTGEAKFAFNVVACDEFIESFDVKGITALELGDEAKLQPEETKVFEIKNTKDGYTNFVSAEGDNLSVQMFDANFTSCGYDSSEIYETGGIYQYVSMNDRFSDVFFAVVSNESEKEVTVKYISELELFCGDSEEIALNTPIQLADQEDWGHGECIFRFTADETRTFDLTFKSDAEITLDLLARDIKDYDPVVADCEFTVTNGTFTVGDVSLEEGVTYAIIIHAETDTYGDVELTVK